MADRYAALRHLLKAARGAVRRGAMPSALDDLDEALAEVARIAEIEGAEARRFGDHEACLHQEETHG